ncbi:MAG: AlkZ family DNA glycosylase [Thermoleophilia bacterium]|nr:AlkZ family DNA glycosylase [Thermoleophilia bacterium]
MTVLRRVTDAERRARLVRRHLLAPSARRDDPEGIADALVALHSSDPATVYLSAAARMAVPSLAAVDDALYVRRAVVRHHAMRRTVWVMTPPVARAAHAACTVGLAPVEWRRLARMVEDSGVAADGAAWVAVARAHTLTALHEIGTAGARELGRHVPELTAKLHLAVGKPYAGTQGAHARILQNLGFDGAIIRGRPTAGTWTAGEYAWSAAEDWLPGGVAGMDPAEAARDLLERSLRAFGPVTTADIRWWAGWTAATATRALRATGAVPVETEAGPAWLHPDDTAPVDDLEPCVALLPALDPTTMGWRERGWTLGDHGAFAGPLFDRNGNAGPTVWVDGEVVGGWGQRRDGTVVTRLLTRVAQRRAAQVRRAAERLTALLDGRVVRPRFPTPLQTELAKEETA